MRRRLSWLLIVCLIIACVGCGKATQKNDKDIEGRQSNKETSENSFNEDKYDVQVEPHPSGCECCIPKVNENDSDAKKIQLTIWVPSAEMNVIKSLCWRFDNAHTEYDFDFVYKEIDDTDIYSKISSGDTMDADIFYFTNDQLSQLVESEYIMELSQEVYERVEEKHDSRAVESCMVDEKLYAIPYTVEMMYLFYNKNLFTEEEVKNLDTMMVKDIMNCDYNFSMLMDDGWNVASYYVGGGCSMPEADGTFSSDWTTDRGVAIADYLDSLVSNSRFYKCENVDDIIDLLADGKCASICADYKNYKEIREALGNNYEVCELPQFTYDYKGEKVTSNMASFGTYKSIGINKNTKYPAQVALLTEYLTGETAGDYRIKVYSATPTYKALIDVIRGDKYEDPVVRAGVNHMSKVIVKPT